MDADTLALFRLAHNYFRQPGKYRQEVDRYRISGREVVSLVALLEQGNHYGEDHDEIAKSLDIDPSQAKQIILNFLGRYLAGSSANYYQVLGLPRNAPDGLVREQYRRLMAVFHPDKNEYDSRLATLINEAYNVLKKSDKREAYDKKLRESFRQSVKASSSGTGKTRPNRHGRSDTPRRSLIDVIYRVPGLSRHPRLFIWSGAVVIIVVIAVFPNMVKQSVRAPAYIHVSDNAINVARPAAKAPIDIPATAQVDPVLADDEPALDSLLHGYETRMAMTDTVEEEHRNTTDDIHQLPGTLDHIQVGKDDSLREVNAGEHVEEIVGITSKQGSQVQNSETSSDVVAISSAGAEAAVTPSSGRDSTVEQIVEIQSKHPVVAAQHEAPGKAVVTLDSLAGSEEAATPPSKFDDTEDEMAAIESEQPVIAASREVSGAVAAIPVSSAGTVEETVTTTRTGRTREQGAVFVQRVNFNSRVNAKVKVATADISSRDGQGNKFKMGGMPPEMIFMNYVSRYESGDVKGILNLVPDEITAHNGKGKEYIQRSYQELFNSTSGRHINVKELAVNPLSTSENVLVCNLALQLMFNDEYEPRLYNGVLTMRVVEGMHGQEIAEVHYDLN